MVSLSSVKEIKIDCHSDSRGSLFPIEFSKLPIDPKRVFYVTGVTDRSTRGEHSHYKTNQVLICVKGECLVTCKDGEDSKEWTLSNPSQGLFIPSMIWDEQIYTTPETILIVLSDTAYQKSDYIEDWNQYCNIMKKEREKNVL